MIFERIWNWISNPANLGIVGSLASIIGLPVALWQLKDVKTKVKASQIAVDSMVNMKKYEKLGSIRERLNKQHDLFIKLKTRLGGRGNSKQSENDTLTSMILELNHCDHDLPIGFDSVSMEIRKAINNLEDMWNGKKGKRQVSGRMY